MRPDRATAVGSRLKNTLEGTLGDDVIHADGGTDFRNGGPGNDPVCGGGGSDEPRGALGDDDLRGGGGGDLLHGCPGSDIARGGEGTDMYRRNREDVRVLTPGPFESTISDCLFTCQP